MSNYQNILDIFKPKQNIILLIIALLAVWAIFNTSKIKTDVNLYKSQIENLQKGIDENQAVNKKIDEQIALVNKKVTKIDEQIGVIDDNLTIVKKKTNEKVNNVSTYGNVELEQLFAARYNQSSTSN